MFTSQRKLICFFLTSTLLVQPVHATTNILTWISGLQPVISLSVGPSWEGAGATQTLHLTPAIIKTYVAHKANYTLASGDIFMGVQTCLPKNLQGQLGLDFALTGGATLNGNIWDDGEPIFNNYTYQYKVQHKHLALKSKLLADWYAPLIPWVSASLGVGFNKSYSFSSSPIIYQAIAMPAFQSKITTAFTYTIGIGLAYAFNPHWQASLGYEFADWGKSQLGGAAGATINTSLSLSHLYTNSLSFNLAYLG